MSNFLEDAYSTTEPVALSRKYADLNPYNIERAQGLYMEYSPGIVYDLTKAPPSGSDPQFTWTNIFTPYKQVDGVFVSYHVWVRFKVGEKGSWGSPVRLVYGKDGVDGKDGLIGSNGLNGANGISVIFAEVQEGGHLWIYLSDGTQIDAGYVMGASAPLVLVQYSIDGVTWSNTPTVPTFYIRFSNDDGATWGNAVEIAADTGHLVPYTGASQDVDLGTNGITANDLTLTSLLSVNALGTDSLGNVIDNGIVLYFDAIVSNEAELLAAIAAGKKRIKLGANITLTANLTLVGFYIIDTNTYSITLGAFNLSLSSETTFYGNITGNLTIDQTNVKLIKVGITGNLINSANSTIIDKCTISGTVNNTADYVKITNNTVTGLFTNALGAEYNTITGNIFNGSFTNSDTGVNNEINNNTVGTNTTARPQNFRGTVLNKFGTTDSTDVIHEWQDASGNSIMKLSADSTLNFVNNATIGKITYLGGTNGFTLQSNQSGGSPKIFTFLRADGTTTAFAVAESGALTIIDNISLATAKNINWGSYSSISGAAAGSLTLSYRGDSTNVFKIYEANSATNHVWLNQFGLSLFKNAAASEKLDVVGTTKTQGLRTELTQITAVYTAASKTNYKFRLKATSNVVLLELLQTTTANHGQEYVCKATDVTNLITVVAFSKTAATILSITDLGGSTFRYTIETGSIATIIVGSYVKIATSTNTANNGTFQVTATDSSTYFDVLNASGVAETPTSSANYYLSVLDYDMTTLNEVVNFTCDATNDKYETF